MKSETENKKYLVSVTEAARITGLGRDRIYRLLRTDPTFPYIRAGNITKINLPLVKDWINRATEEHREL